LRRRILVTIVAVTAAAVLALFVPAAVVIRSHIERGELLELQRRASIVARGLSATGEIDVTDLGNIAGDDYTVALYNGDLRLVAGTGPDVGDPVVAEAAAGVVNEGYVDADLVAALPVRLDADGPEYTLRVSESSAESWRRVRGALGMLAAAALGIIAVAALAGVLLARRLSRPIEELREWSADSFGHPGAPPPARSGIAELDALGTALAGADERISQLVERERSFSSHVAHQLKTPVAAMRVAIEAELDNPRPNHRTVLVESLGALDRLESTIASLLALARHRPRQFVWCDVAAVVASHADRWQPRYAAEGRSLLADGAAAWASVDVSVIDHVLDVLLDNALTHGAGVVEVSTRTVDGHVEIRVGDGGSLAAGIDAFSEKRSDTSHGIGLRLARTLAESAGGELTLCATTPTVFALLLPTSTEDLPRAETALTAH
jgi:signal transduction histidine kinase